MDPVAKINSNKLDETEYLLKSDANKERLYNSIKSVECNSDLKEINFSELKKIIKSKKKK